MATQTALSGKHRLSLALTSGYRRNFGNRFFLDPTRANTIRQKASLPTRGRIKGVRESKGWRMSLMDKMGLHLDEFGDSSERLTDV